MSVLPLIVADASRTCSAKISLANTYGAFDMPPNWVGLHEEP